LLSCPRDPAFVLFVFSVVNLRALPAVGTTGRRG
jgi:hypothetical protein